MSALRARALVAAAYLMSLNMSAPSCVDSSPTPNDLSSGSAGAGGPSCFCFFSTGPTVELAGADTDADTDPARPAKAVAGFSSTGLMMKALLRLPNQPALFLRPRLGLPLSVVLGEPGRSAVAWSLDAGGRRPSSLRTDDGRLPCAGGLSGGGDRVLSLVLAGASWSVDADGGTVVDDTAPSTDGFGAAGGGAAPPLRDASCFGLGWPALSAARGGLGGESGGAGIEVPSVREKSTGVKLSGW